MYSTNIYNILQTYYPNYIIIDFTDYLMGIQTHEDNYNPLT